MSLSHYMSYFLLVLVLVYSPGPMTLFLMANGMRSNMRNTYPILLGANHAYFISIIIFSVGLAAVLQQHVLLLKSVQVMGIIYLIYLSVMQWRKKPFAMAELKDNPEMGYTKGSLYRRGAFVALTNPKALLLFTVVFPQFTSNTISYNLQIAILGATFLVLQFSSGCFYAFLGNRISKVIQNTHNQSIINKVSALVLIIVAGFLIERL